jgi:hypothetical protein
MYFVLTCPPLVNAKGEALMEIHNCFEVGNVWSWCDGLALEPEERDFSVPILIDFEPFRGYAGPPRELVDVCIPLMSKRLTEVLLEAGVKNLELYPVLLTNTVTGETHDYHAFKLIGLIAAADMQQSQWSRYDARAEGDTSFTSLALDESKTGGRLLFRLKENINALLVHESVRDRILAKGIDTLTFVKPEEWVQV